MFSLSSLFCITRSHSFLNCGWFDCERAAESRWAVRLLMRSTCFVCPSNRTCVCVCVCVSVLMSLCLSFCRTYAMLASSRVVRRPTWRVFVERWAFVMSGGIYCWVCYFHAWIDEFCLLLSRVAASAVKVIVRRWIILCECGIWTCNTFIWRTTRNGTT